MNYVHLEIGIKDVAGVGTEEDDKDGHFIQE